MLVPVATHLSAGLPGTAIVLERIRPAPGARVAPCGLTALLEAVEAAIIGRGVVEDAPRPVGTGARSGCADQQQQGDTSNQLIHAFLLVASSPWRVARQRPQAELLKLESTLPVVFHAEAAAPPSNV